MSIGLVLGLANAFLPQHMGNWVKEHTTTVIAMGFVCNMIGGALLQTGAFEIELDGVVVFSKLKENEFPNLAQLLDNLRQIMSQKQ